MPEKDLHIAKSMGDLQKKCEVHLDTISKRDTEKLRSLLQLLQAKSSEAISNSDEEVAYMYLYRALNIWNLIMDTKDFKEDKKFFKLQYGKEIEDMLNKLSKYTNSLEQRYASKRNCDKEIKDAHFELLSSIDIKSKTKSKTKIDDNNHIKKINLNSRKKYSIDYGIIIREDTGSATGTDGEIPTIQCSELWEMVSSKRSVLIVDIRTAVDFMNTKLKNLDSINIPESSITYGLSAHLLGEKIESNDQRLFWNHRDQYDQLVLMDWSSEKKDVIPSNSLFNLLNILTKWDPNVIYKNKPLILNGGFACWMDCYPICTTNANTARLKKSTFNLPNTMLSFSDVNDIEYPINELEEIGRLKSKSMSYEPENPTNSSDIPFVDRSTKNTITHNDSFEVASSINTSKASSEETIVNHADTNGPYTSEDANSLHNLQSSHSLAPLKLYDKGDGNGIMNTENTKFDKLPQTSNLKRSASSPNINKIGVDLDLSEHRVPTFDRSTKPSQQPHIENYYRDVNNDTVYAADNKKGVGLTGLKNLGNLCYMNSIMQCISNTVQLTRDLTQFNPNKSINKQLIATEVCSVLRILWQGDSRTTSCRDLKVKVGKLRQSFSTSEQQDSHEFLTILMDWLHEDLNIPSSIKSLEGAVESTGEKAWGEFRQNNNSIVIDLYYGQLKSTVTCKACGKESILFEPFSNLSIPLPPQGMWNDNDHKCTLQECLKLYLKGEVINGWICPSCNSPREATKKLDITRLPPVLIIHLKRFMTDVVSGNRCRKRMDLVDFPIFNLDMKPYTPSESEQRFHNYNLYAVSNHYGSMDSGHYTAYCKNHIHNRWYKFDDQDVNEMVQNEVKTSAAYILFYESRATDAFH